MQIKDIDPETVDILLECLAIMAIQYDKKYEMYPESPYEGEAFLQFVYEDVFDRNFNRERYRELLND